MHFLTVLYPNTTLPRMTGEIWARSQRGLEESLKLEKMERVGKDTTLERQGLLSFQVMRNPCQPFPYDKIQAQSCEQLPYPNIIHWKNNEHEESLLIAVDCLFRIFLVKFETGPCTWRAGETRERDSHSGFVGGGAELKRTYIGGLVLGPQEE